MYVLFMNVTVIGAQKISNDHGGLSAFYTLGSNDFGTSLAALGDWDGDGIPDMAVGAYEDDDGSGYKRARSTSSSSTRTAPPRP